MLQQKKKRVSRAPSEALQQWSASVNDREPLTLSHEASSIVIRGDVVYHYGEHYPMAMMARNKSGKVIAVYVNSTRWEGSTGFGPSTDSRVSELHGYLRQDARVPIHKIPLSGDIVLVEEDPKDPEPIVPSLDIPVCPRSYTPTDPGPKPVLDTDHPNCIAGTREEYSYQQADVSWPGRSWSTPIPSNAWIRSTSERGAIHFTTEHNGVLVFGISSWDYERKASGEREKYKQCPHCRAHDRATARWYSMMRGGGSRIGWQQYSAMIEKFGTIEAWREARRELVAERKVKTSEHIAWRAKNTAPLNRVPDKKMGNVKIPMINPATGRITRSTFAKMKREERASTRRMQEHYAQQEADREARRNAA